MKIRTKKDCREVARLIGAEDISALTIEEAHGISENTEKIKRENLKLKLKRARSQAGRWEVFNESPKGSEVEYHTFRKLYESARTQRERWAVLLEETSCSEIKFRVARDIITHSTSRDELLKIYRDNSLNELGEEALRKLCKLL